MLAQYQIINKILQKQDASILTTNGLDENYFLGCQAEYKFIKAHLDKYSKVPDKLTFLQAFPDFNFVETTEPDSYLLSQIYEEYNRNYLAASFNKIKSLIESQRIDEASTYFQNAVDGLKKSSIMTCTDLLTDTSRYDHYIEKTTNNAKYYLKTGFVEYDQLIGGIDRKNENLVIMARPGIGKSNLLLKIACAASMQGLTVGIYEGEMTADKVGYRIDAFLSHISNTAMNRGWLQIQGSYENYIKSLSKTNYGPIKIITPNDVPGGIVTVDTLEAFIDQQKLDILFVDQYDLLEDNGYSKIEHERVGHIAKMIKALQVKKQIPIISVCQMNRTKNDDGSQDTTQAAGSDKISRYATVMIALTQKRNEDNSMQLTLDIIKSRDGGNGNKLVYLVDFDKGTFDYIGDAKDGVSAPTDIENLENNFAKRNEAGDLEEFVY